MRILAVALALVLTHGAALAQNSDGTVRVEVWGLKGETQQEFEARHRDATGLGLEGACMATLKGRMGYRVPVVMTFPNPDSAELSTMLISIGDLPPYAFPTTSNELRALELTTDWSAIREIVATEPGGLGSMEFYYATKALLEHQGGDRAALSQAIAADKAMLESLGATLDVALTERIAAALLEAGGAPVELTADIYLHSDDPTERSLAAHVLLNHLDDARVIDAFARSIWERDLGGHARMILTTCLRNAREAGTGLPGRPISEHFDGELLAAMLSHPNPELCDLALEVLASDPENEKLVATALAGGAITVKHYLRSKLAKHGQYARDFRSDAIALLRTLNAVDYGSDPEAWVAWIESFANR